MATPENLSLWDRLFNRTRREIHARGEQTWICRDPYGQKVYGSERVRSWVEYRVIDRVTGSGTIGASI